MCEVGVCVCIKWAINCSFLWRGSPWPALWTFSTLASVAIILNPLWLPPLWNHGPPFWFLYSWLPSAREDPEGLCGPGSVVPANVAEGESRRITPHEDGVSLGCWAPCVRIFLFQELTENGTSWYSDWRAPNVTIFLVSVGAFFAEYF